MVEIDNTEIIIKEKEWFTEFADYQKIKAYCTGKDLKKLIEENKTMEVFCTPKHFEHVMSKKDFFESKNTKELCRNGIPYFYIKDFFLKMFSCQNELEESFKLKYNKVFKKRDTSKLGDYVPYLTGYKTFDESLQCCFLNERGIQSVKEVQWLLNSLIPTMEFSPILLKLNSILHLYFSSSQVFFILKNLINLNYSLKETYKIRWHMRFNYDDNSKVITSIIESLKEISGKSGKCTMEHLDSLGITAKAIVEDIVFNFFLGYLSFEALMRLFPFFLREGTKALYRMVYSFFKQIQHKVLELKDPKTVKDEIKKAGLAITDISKLFYDAFNYSLNRNNNKYDFTPVPEGDEFSNRRTSYYLPSLTEIEKSKRILDEDGIIRLWQNFPLEIKIKDCNMIYSSSVHGFNLKSVYQVSESLLSKNLNSENDYTSLFIIQTQNDEIFGGCMSRLISPTFNNKVSPQFAILIKFTPEFEVFSISENSKLDLISGDESSFLFVIGENGAAIRLDDSLNHGYSNPCAAFNSPALTINTDGEYFIKNFEVYNLV